MRPLVSTLALLILVGTALAEEPPVLRQPGGTGPLRLSAVRVHYDNDQGAQVIGDTDRWYSSGSALEFTYQPCWAERLAARMPDACRFGPAKAGAGLVLGALLFTPENLSTPALIEDDRPYAGYLYGGMFWQRSNCRLLDHLQVDIGAVGPSLGAERVQRKLHEWGGHPDPKGWKNQLQDEVTVQTYARRRWRLEPTTARDPVRVQAIPMAGFALGSVYRQLEGGLLLRAGWKLPDDFGPARLADPGTATQRSLRRGLSGYVFARGSGRLVEHNLFLDGNTFRRSHHVAKEPWVGEFQAGLELSYGFRRSSLSLAFYTTWQSPEFRAQRERHLYTSLTLSYAWLH